MEKEFEALLKRLENDGKVDFSQVLEFADSDKKGEFEGILVKYENEKLAHGYYRFAKDSLKVNNGKKLHILYQHMGSQIPVGTMEGTSDSEGFKIKAKLDLTLLENGNPVNPAAHALYSLMKNQGSKFDLSVGGRITVREIVEKDNNRFINIKEFVAHEGSIVMVGAVEGSEITNVFSEDTTFNEDEEIKLKDGGNENMDPKLLEFLTQEFGKLEAKMLGAESEKQINEFKEQFEAFKTEFTGFSEELKAEFADKMEQINDIAKKLETNYTATPDELEAGLECSAIFNMAMNKGQTEFTVDSNTELNLEEAFGKDYAKFAASTTSLPVAVKPTYVTKILERIQEANPFLSRIAFMPITDNSLNIDREVLGLPAVGWVGEEDVRAETSGVDLDDVNINLYQLYAMPVVTNKLLATNYVGFLPFLLKRTEYAMGLKLANTIMNGDGVKKPLGVLQDPAVTQNIAWDLTPSTGAELDDGAFADKILDAYYSVRGEISGNSIWYFRRESWAKIAKLKNTQKDFYITDLNTGNTRTLMGRPVVLVESDDSGLVPIDTAVDGEYWGLFCDEQNGIQAIVNNGLNMRIEDKVTAKGFTKYYMEKLLGAGVQLPEYFTKLSVTIS